MNEQIRQSKICVECGVDFPLLVRYYDRDNASIDGFRPVCKLCRSKLTAPAMDAELLAKIKSLDAEGLRALDRVTTKGSDSPHLAEVYQCLMDLYGGAAGYADRLYAQFLSTKPGSFLRTRMLEQVAKMSEKVTATGMATVTNDMLTTEELEKLHAKSIESMIPRLQAQQQRRDRKERKKVSEEDEIDSQEYVDEHTAEGDEA